MDPCKAGGWCGASVAEGDGPRQEMNLRLRAGFKFIKRLQFVCLAEVVCKRFRVARSIFRPEEIKKVAAGERQFG